MIQVNNRQRVRRAAVLRRDGGREVLVELAGVGEEEEEQVDVAEDGELPGLLEQPVAALVEGGLPLRGVLDPLYLAAPPPHLLLSSSNSQEDAFALPRSPRRCCENKEKAIAATSSLTQPGTVLRAEKSLRGTSRVDATVGGEAIERGGATPRSLLAFAFEEGAKQPTADSLARTLGVCVFVQVVRALGWLVACGCTSGLRRLACFCRRDVRETTATCQGTGRDRSAKAETSQQPAPAGIYTPRTLADRTVASPGATYYQECVRT
jgi:hypothetical protein